VLVGVFRPAVLIPPELDRPEALESLRLSLLHELAHAEGRDPWFGLLGHVAQSVWFFLPPLWWVVSQSRLDQEFLADRRAALRFGPLGEYASSLLGLAAPAAGEAPGARFLPVGSVSPGSGSALFRRMLMLLRCPYPVEAEPPVWWSWCLPCAALAVTFGASSFSVRPGAGAAPAVEATASAPQANSFQVSRLEVVPTSPDSNGRAPRFDLPVRLPARFRLDLEVWGDTRTLSQTRVAGLPIEPLDPPAESELPTWHAVAISRDGPHVALSINGRPAIASDGLTERLAVEPPPEQAAFFRRIRLVW
jgi:hypothetical protein